MDSLGLFNRPTLAAPTGGTSKSPLCFNQGAMCMRILGIGKCAQQGLVTYPRCSVEIWGVLPAINAARAPTLKRVNLTPAL